MMRRGICYWGSGTKKVEEFNRGAGRSCFNSDPLVTPVKSFAQGAGKGTNGPKSERMKPKGPKREIEGPVRVRSLKNPLENWQTNQSPRGG